MPERIRQVLSYFSLNQTSMASLVGMKQSIISDWINGKSLMPQSTAMAFQAVLGVRWQWLLHGEGEMLMAKSGHLTDDQKTMVDLMSALTPDQRMRLIGMAEGMIAARRLEKGKT